MLQTLFIFSHMSRFSISVNHIDSNFGSLLTTWTDELEPGRRPKRSDTRQVSREVERKAVIDLVIRRGAAKVIADGLGIDRGNRSQHQTRKTAKEASSRPGGSTKVHPHGAKARACDPGTMCASGSCQWSSQELFLPAPFCRIALYVSLAFSKTRWRLSQYSLQSKRV